MTKYRIVQVGEIFHIEWKGWFQWYRYPIPHDSQKSAEISIESELKKELERKNPKIVKTY